MIVRPLAAFRGEVFRTADFACSRSRRARTRFGGFFFFRDFGIGDGLLTVAVNDAPFAFIYGSGAA
jgi:hypothetical protein